MSSAESVVYKYVAERSKLFGEFLAVLGLFFSVAGVLQKDNVAVLHSLDSCLGVGTYNFVVSGEFDLLT